MILSEFMKAAGVRLAVSAAEPLIVAALAFLYQNKDRYLTL